MQTGSMMVLILFFNPSASKIVFNLSSIIFFTFLIFFLPENRNILLEINCLPDGDIFRRYRGNSVLPSARQRFDMNLIALTDG